VTRQITLPAGTVLELALDTPVSSRASKTNDLIRAHVAKAVLVDRKIVIPAGAPAEGTVVEANPSAVDGRASIIVKFDHVTVEGQSYGITTLGVMREAADGDKSGASLEVRLGSGTLLRATIEEPVRIRAPI
jgi:hypothetical protein